MISKPSVIRSFNEWLHRPIDEQDALDFLTAFVILIFWLVATAAMKGR